MPIDSIESLHAHLQIALQVEHATIPPYLTALYSIEDGHNPEACEVIQSVVMEEMLHMTLVANVLNAVRGTPRVAYKEFVPDYPTALPHSAGTFQVGLLKFSKDALETFVRIERPAPHDAPAEADDFHTIGQFYKAVMEAIVRLEEAQPPGQTIFTGDRDRQIKPHHFYYGGGGESIEVHNLPTATKALEEVIEQGEGLDHTIFDGDTHFGQQEEVAHYFRFNEMLVGRYYLDTDTPSSGPTGGEFPVDWSAVWNMAPNPKAARYADQPEVFEKMADFNRGYTRLLGTLDRAFNGAPDDLIPAVPEMYELRQAAQRLMKIPTGEGDTRVGPSFEYWED